MRNTAGPIIVAIAVIITGYILGKSFKDRYDYQNNITVTGLGSTDFESNLIVWSGYFKKKNPDLKEAYAQLDSDRSIIREYLLSKGIEGDLIKFSSVDIDRDYDSFYDTNGKYVSRFSGYSLNQSVNIESRELDKIDNLSREVTELINKGVEFYSNQPEYYYTKLDSLKLDLIAKATEDARKRAENIANNAGAKLGELTNASMGVFQIIAQNSSEDFSWGGTFNTASRYKTANITVKLAFESK